MKILPAVLQFFVFSDVVQVMRLMHNEIGNGGNDKVSHGEYVGEHLFCLLIGYVWYRMFLFECLSGLTYTQSKLILWMIIILACGICYLLTFKRNRTKINAFINVLFPFGIYTLFAMGDMFKAAAIIGGAVVMLLVIILGCCIFIRKIKEDANRRKVIKRRLINWIIGSRAIATFVMVAVIGGMLTSILLNGNMMMAKTEAVISTEKESEWRVAEKTDQLINLKEENWRRLSAQEKLDILQVVANIEVRYLGIGHEINVGTAPLREDVLGQYMDNTRTVSIDTEHLHNDTAEELMNTLIHECRHAYQKRAIEALSEVPQEYYSLFMFYDACLFYQGDKKYGDDKPEGYYLNYLEIDAREYAQESVKMFFDEIDRCLAEKQTENEQ